MRPTVGLALELCGLPGAASARFRIAPGAPLVAGGLVEITEPERPPLSRVLAVPDRVTGHLLGSDRPDARLAGVLGVAREDPTAEEADVLRTAAAAGTGVGLVHLRTRGGDAAELATAALRAAGLRPLVLDAVALTRRAGDVPELARVAALEARLTGAGVVLGPLEALPGEPTERARTLGALCTALRGIPLITHGTVGWAPEWAADTPVELAVEAPSPERQTARWRHALERAAAPAPQAPPTPVEASGPVTPTSSPRRSPRTVWTPGRCAAPPTWRYARPPSRAARSAPTTCAAPYEPRTARGSTGSPAGWSRTSAGTTWCCRRPRTGGCANWRCGPAIVSRCSGSGGCGPAAAGGAVWSRSSPHESGTGKTMSAEVVATDLGMDLYVVDLSTVVDKYIGETEKNLERIFTEASAVNAVLLFDEADAIFGKRSAVKDAHDRHANIESAYLLQRMESFDGIAVLTTNLRANLDEAFTRRLDVVADFPVPDPGQRLALWERCLGVRLPRADDLDLAFCADRFELMRRLHPRLRGHRRLPRGGGRHSAHHAAVGDGGRAGVPQAGAAGAGGGVRAVHGGGVRRLRCLPALIHGVRATQRAEQGVEGARGVWSPRGVGSRLAGST